MRENLLKNFFAEKVLGEEYTAEKGAFIASIFENGTRGNLCFQGEGPDLPPSVVSIGGEYPKTPIVKDQNRYYLQKNWVLESQLLHDLKRLSRNRQELPTIEIDKEENLSRDQKKAVRHLFFNSFSVLCGGPGTGKTHTIAYFIRSFLRTVDVPNFRILLASPTGKAALHLQSSILSKVGLEYEAMTVHRLLGLRGKEVDLFSRSRIDAHLVIIDEASMMDASLLAHLLSSVGEETRLVLMGDPNQLPPVDGPGVFSEIADLYGVFLNKCMRTEDPLLHNVAEAILKGDKKQFFSSVRVAPFPDDLIESLYERIVPVISREQIVPEDFFEREKKLKVLDCLRVGPFGLEEINRKILEKMARDCPDGYWWAVPIMVTVNLPEQNLYNGLTGVLIGKKQGRLNLFEGTAHFPNRMNFTPPPSYELSFVISIHKSQGSEFEEVIALFPTGSESFGKEALYTAATRAKKKWEILSEKEVLEKIISRKGSAISGLKKRSSVE